MKWALLNATHAREKSREAVAAMAPKFCGRIMRNGACIARAHEHPEYGMLSVVTDWAGPGTADVIKLGRSW